MYAESNDSSPWSVILFMTQIYSFRQISIEIHALRDGVT